ncbi:hypothetical protein FB45DRAFT_1105954 [Roridomyces roridus]|uniref:Uncharacterized protein n=1 Tax=Roridomyces roridus TaxID=1738132 RepID=A0AAD7BCM5_9AGAR|nr:hypothetical protein FB45DRAFT_1105954 [Roridomyces roridus]
MAEHMESGKLSYHSEIVGSTPPRSLDGATPAIALAGRTLPDDCGRQATCRRLRFAWTTECSPTRAFSNRARGYEPKAPIADLRSELPGNSGTVALSWLVGSRELEQLLRYPTIRPARGYDLHKAHTRGSFFSQGQTDVAVVCHESEDTMREVSFGTQIAGPSNSARGARGSWLVARGSWLVARGSWPWSQRCFCGKQIGPVLCAAGFPSTSGARRARTFDGSSLTVQLRWKVVAETSIVLAASLPVGVV